MGNYAQAEDIKAIVDERILIDLTDDERIGQINEDRINEVIANAEALVNGYVGSRYQVPVAPAPALLKTYTVDITIYRLYMRRTIEMPENRQDAYKDALRQLEAIAAGRISLGTADAPASTEQNGAWTNKDTSTNTFGRDNLGGF